MSDLTMLFNQRSKVSIRRGVTGIALKDHIANSQWEFAAHCPQRNWLAATCCDHRSNLAIVHNIHFVRLAEATTIAVGAGLLVDSKDFAEALRVGVQRGSNVRSLSTVVALAAHIASSDCSACTSCVTFVLEDAASAVMVLLSFFAF